ncbi:ABC transporter permease [Croceicoccus sp. F390]|uniref:Transport permease protein n=1 Tax=Croceicoccus esteveae TaxID=3075597 RepID=A0ABU2ZHC5_9SPHN|nr:ABC transporter permease [Croceicoccus sp. F390]MDT0575463.1 ABC transporter permease [Croceicoccus sp. F390]
MIDAGFMTARQISYWKDVVVLLVSRDFRGRYKHTKIGVLWSIASPIMFLLIFYFLFQRVINLDIPKYASFAFTGIIVWNWTQQALLASASSISANQGLVAQPGFPIAAMPIIAVASALLNLLIAFPLLMLLAWADGAEFTMTLAALPLIVVTQFLFILSISYIIAALNVGLRDIEQILPILLQLGYYITPIFFSLSNVPGEFEPVFLANPMTLIITSYREVVMDGAWPDFGALGMLVLVSGVLLFIGIRTFSRARYRFLEEL